MPEEFIRKREAKGRQVGGEANGVSSLSALSNAYLRMPDQTPTFV